MSRHSRWLIILAVAAAILVPAAALASEECVTHYSWKCDDDPNNTCVGIFSEGNQFVYTESGEFEPPHELKYTLRFSPQIAGPQYVRMSGIAQHFSDPSETTEVFQVLKRQESGCTEVGMAPVVTTFDVQCCSQVGDYSLGYTSTTDICITVKSTESNQLRDELLVHHAPNHYHPVIATKFDDRNCPDSQTTNPGTVISGTLNDVCVCKPGVYERIREGGSQHRLWHVYKIDDIPSGSAQTLKVKGYRPTNQDGDDFKILFKWSSNCTGIFQNSGVSINSNSNQEYTVNVGSSSGSLCVALDDSAGGSSDDDVYVDHVWVVTTP